MEVKALTLKDKNLFEKFLRLDRHELAVYAFENIYLWMRLYQIYWTVIEDELCVFFKDKIGSFLYLPPLGKTLKQEVTEEVFRMMDGWNKNKALSRIENVEQDRLDFYRQLGYVGKEKFPDYLCLRQDLVDLKGNKLKPKRASFNYFIKHYNFSYIPFSLRYKDACLELYAQWLKERKAETQDALYQGMLKDSRDCLKVLLDDYRSLSLVARLVKIGREIKAFTFGFRLNREIFCILYEITNLAIKGLSQFIFREFCRELTDYKYINIMDDSGLENLRKVKLSYRPVKLIPSYIVMRKE